MQLDRGGNAGVLTKMDNSRRVTIACCVKINCYLSLGDKEV